MHRKPDGPNHPEPDVHSYKPETNRAQPWWCSKRQDSVLMNVLGTKTTESLSMVKTDEKLCYNEKCGDEQPYLQRAAIPVICSTMSECVPPPTQMELVGHSACPPYPYADSYYGRALPPYVPQSLVHSHGLGVHPSRMAFPLEMAEEPVYVNAKQYHGILRRRHSRAKAELEKKVIKARKPYLHESRHLHAMRRARGCGGRFLNTKKLGNDASKATPDKTMQNSNSYSEPQGTTMQQAFSDSDGRTYSDSNSCFLHQQGFHFSTSHSLSDKTLGGECPSGSGMHERIMANGVSHMALTIK